MLPDIMRDEVFRLETPRLWLRWPRNGDADALAAMAGDAGVAQMTAHIPHPYPDGEAMRHVARARAGNEQGRAAIFVMTRKAWPDIALGMIGLHVAGDDALDTEPLTVGYFVGRAQWGRGYASEALRAMAAAAFLLTPTSSIAAGAMASNPASRRVQEKCGFEYIGSAVEHFSARGAMVAVDNLTLTRERWRRLSRRVATPTIATPRVARGDIDSTCL